MQVLQPVDVERVCEREKRDYVEQLKKSFALTRGPKVQLGGSVPSGGGTGIILVSTGYQGFCITNGFSPVQRRTEGIHRSTYRMIYLLTIIRRQNKNYF